MSDPLEPSVFYESIIENTKTVVWNIRVYLTIRLYQIQRTVFNVLNRKHIKRVLLLYLEKENRHMKFFDSITKLPNMKILVKKELFPVRSLLE